MKSSLLREAVRIAREKLPRHPERSHWPHTSFIVQGNKIIEYGFNHSGIPPRHLGYHERISWSSPKTHSELACWRAAKGLLNPNHSWEIINIRLSRGEGELRDSKPCVCCHQFLTSVGCTTCYFSTNVGFARIGM